MITVEGLAGIKATIIQDSIAFSGKRIITYELEYQRYIHAELMTHRQFSRNAASSRAIPVERMLETIENNPAEPVTWQKNQPGMQSSEDFQGDELTAVQNAWHDSVMSAVGHSKKLGSLGLHKQWANRPTEFGQIMKTVVTSTEWDNWFWLRDHKDAQPDIQQLARCMWEAKEQSVPMELSSGEWHVPYVDRRRDIYDVLEYYSGNTKISLEDARMVSASCCAQVSYRKQDTSIEKAKSIFDRLINSEPVHASPIEHQARPMDFNIHIFDNVEWVDGVTHMLRDKRLCSGNFIGWIQFRQLIPNNVK